MWPIRRNVVKTKGNKNSGVAMMIGLVIMSVLDPAKRAAIEAVQKRKEMPADEEAVDGQ